VKANIKRSVLIVSVLTVAVAAGAAWWLIVGKSAPRASVEAASCPEKPGELKNLALAPTSVPTGSLKVTDNADRPHTFGEWRGTPLIVNFWATWCAPCVAEMPALAKLQAALGTDVMVITLSEDRVPTTAGGGELSVPALIEKFYDVNSITGLPVLIDPAGQVARAFQVEGLLTTVLIDALGREQGRIVGPAQWSGEAVKAFLADCLKRLGEV
jgi:thiol-disulfide isomerase/thioredoxin